MIEGAQPGRTRRAVRRAAAGVSVALVTGALLAAAWPASEHTADAAYKRLRLSPGPLSSRSLYVKWRPDHARLRGRVYTMELRLSGGSSDLCSRSRIWTIRRGWNKNDIVSVRLRPLDRTLGAMSLWCPGPATLRVVSTAAGNRRTTQDLLRFKMPADPQHPVPSGTPVEVNLLEGSTVAVKVAGRPDRTSTQVRPPRRHVRTSLSPRRDTAALTPSYAARLAAGARSAGPATIV